MFFPFALDPQKASLIMFTHLRSSSSLVYTCSVLALLAGACSSPGGDDASVPPFDGNLPGRSGDEAAEPVVPVEPGDGPVDEPGEAVESTEQAPTDLTLEPGTMEPESGDPAQTETGEPEVVPVDEEVVVPPEEPVPSEPVVGLPTRGTANLFTELLGIPEREVDDKVRLAVNRVFGIGTGESTTPVADSGYRVYYELPQDPSMAFMWAADSADIRSEGMSYGMMIAVQMDMQDEFNRLWKFAQTFMQYPANSNITAWRYYFRWEGAVNTGNANNWQVNYGAQTGPAPDGEEYFAAALYLADRRWGSNGGVNYQQDADNVARAMLNNPTQGSRTPVFNQGQNMVVFYPDGNSAVFSDPSYHLPAFYELFAQDGPQGDANRWRQAAQVSRQYLVTSAHPTTGLHPDYANFNGTPNTGGSNHNEFRYDAWRVVMNMAVDYAWFGTEDARMRTQVEKYHAFFANRLTNSNVTNQTFQLDGSGAAGGGSTALTATLASGALASNAPNRERYLENLWNVEQQTGLYRYYQETVYLLGLLAASGHYGYEWSDAAP